MTHTLTITLNPAVDMTTEVPELLPGRKLRCSEPRLDAGGGGVNVSRMIREMGGKTTALVAVGGATGQLLCELLENAGVEIATVQAEGKTRQSLAVHDLAKGEQYRFVFPGPLQDGGFTQRLHDKVAELLGGGAYSIVVASGSLPPGLPDGFFGDLAALVSDCGSRFILDTSGPPLRAALGRGLFLVKPDRHEARALAEELGLPAESPEGLARSIVEGGGAEVAIVTKGPEGAVLASADDTVHIPSPAVEVVSLVGAGDSFMGALCFALAGGRSLRQACAYGVAAAAATALTEATELAHRADVERFYAEIEPTIGA